MDHRSFWSVIRNSWNDRENSEKRQNYGNSVIIGPAVNNNFSTFECRTILCSIFKFIQSYYISFDIIGLQHCSTSEDSATQLRELIQL